FFQAEDGIRDFHVTGVQTCALPISGFPRRVPIAEVWVLDVDTLVRDGRLDRLRAHLSAQERDRQTAFHVEADAVAYTAAHGLARSEERRVGRESRSVGAARR